MYLDDAFKFCQSCPFLDWHCRDLLRATGGIGGWGEVGRLVQDQEAPSGPGGAPHKCTVHPYHPDG